MTYQNIHSIISKSLWEEKCNTMKIMLIQPKMNMRPMDTKLKIKMAPSLALLTLIKLTPVRHQVVSVNENIEKLNYNEPADLVAITVTVDVLSRAIKISQEFRKRGITVIAGGIHISAVPDEVKDYFDAICIGPAERVWKKILNDKENDTLKKVYKDLENITGKEICPPDYNAVNNKKYLYTNVITTSKGCPYKCDFCYNSCLNSANHINRPIDDVISEIIMLRQKHIMFIDDNFIGDPSWTRKFLLRLKPLKIKWNAAVTANILNDLTLLDLMKESGCQSLFIGFETINQNSLKSVHKKQNKIEQYEALISQIHSRGIMINASMVFGLQGDGPDIFELTLEWLVKNKIETVTSHILTPYPGTALYKRMLQEGKIVDFDLSHYNTAHVVFLPENMTAKQLYDGYIWLYKEFYSIKNIIKRMPVNKNQKIPFLLFNFLYRKYGKFTELLSAVIPIGLLGKFAAKLSYHIK